MGILNLRLKLISVLILLGSFNLWGGIKIEIYDYTVYMTSKVSHNKTSEQHTTELEHPTSGLSALQRDHEQLGNAELVERTKSTPQKFESQEESTSPNNFTGMDSMGPFPLMDSKSEGQDSESNPNKKQKKKNGNKFGLGKKVSMQRFAAVAKDLEGNWDGLNPDARAGLLLDAANQELNQAKVPEAETEIKPLSATTNGSFSPWNWTISINSDRYTDKDASSNDIAGVAKTVFEEARHTEQFFTAARLEATNGSDAAEIVQSNNIPYSVAQEAEQRPLKDGSAQIGFAEEIKDAYYGDLHSDVMGELSNSRDNLYEKRDRVNEELAKVKELEEEYKDIPVTFYHQSKLDKAYKKYKEAFDDYKDAYDDYEKAQERYEKAYEAYENLPYEKDAKKLTKKVEKFFHKL